MLANSTNLFHQSRPVVWRPRLNVVPPGCYGVVGVPQHEHGPPAGLEGDTKPLTDGSAVAMLASLKHTRQNLVDTFEYF